MLIVDVHQLAVPVAQVGIQLSDHGAEIGIITGSSGEVDGIHAAKLKL